MSALVCAPALPDIEFREAKHYKRASRTEIDLIVIHSAETPERPTTAESVANYFTNPIQKRGDRLVEVEASAHYTVDSDSIVQSVSEHDVAWHVRTKGFNDRSIGVELCGRASQTREQWLDDYGRAMLPLAARLVASVCERYDIPVVYLPPGQLKDARGGITGHRDLTKAFGRPERHTDPGPNFPWEDFIAMVQANG